MSKAKVLEELKRRAESGIDGLAMDFASRMQRAKEQGFDTDTTYYHGTNADFDEFRVNDDGVNLVGKGVYAAPSGTASGYASDVGSSVYPLLVKGKKASFQDAADAREAIGDGWTNDSVNDWLKDRGFTHRDGRQGIVIFDHEKNIRSPNAAFDPTKKDSSNLLASAGAGIGALGLMGASDDSEASFIGSVAKTWDAGAEALAKKMTNEGASRDEIWQATGQMGSPTFKDVDGRWKQEISDQGFKEKPLYSDTDDNYTTSNDPGRWFSWRDEASDRGGLGIQKGYDLGDLAEAYPQLRGTKILPNEQNAFRGSYDNDRTITVASPDALMSLDEAGYKKFEDEQLGRSIPLHELQHAIQKREGFAVGGNPEEFKADLRALAELNTLSFSEMDDFQKQMFKELRAKYGANKDAHKLYEKLAGEAEARNVQTRLDYDMDKRVQNPPWNTLDVPEDELIVRGNKIAEIGAGIAATSTLPWMAKRAEAAEQERISAQIDESIANMNRGQTIEAPSNPYFQTAADALGRYNQALSGSPAEYLLGAEDLENYFRKGAYGEAGLGDAAMGALNIGEAFAAPLEGIRYLGKITNK